MRNVLAFRDPSPSSRLRMTRLRASLPPRNEQIRVPSLRVRAVRGPHEEFAVGAEHGEAVEGGRGGDALGVAGTVFVEDEDVELAAARVEAHTRNLPSGLNMGKPSKANSSCGP